MHEEIDRRMGTFVADFLGVDADEARRIQKSYFREFGLTLRGLMVRHGLDPEVYRSHMAALDLSHIRPDEALAEAVAALEGRKIIFTNAFACHAEAVLEMIAMADHFEVIHDIEAACYRPKPDVEAYHDLCARYDVDPSRAVMLDDIPHNLEPAARIGMTTVWVRTDAAWARDVAPGPHIHHATDALAAWLRTLTEPS
jgi:putative hydrolase of the HAD superfamily